MKREELKAILQNAYTQEKWIKTLQFLSGSKNLLTILLEPKAIEIKSAKAKEIVSEIVQLGSLKTTDGITLPIFDVTLQDGIKIEYNRVGVNDLLKNHILKDAIKGAIVTFHYNENYNKDEWRFSFISKFGSDYFAEAESVETNPKKFTYIFGTTEEHRTALERLYNLEQSRFRLEDFFEAFNVEPVSNNFFKEYKNFYQDFVFHLSNDKKSRAVFELEKTDDVEKDIRNFVKRLLGRLVFLYFLQKKHWLGATNKNYDDGDTNFLIKLFSFNEDSKDNFYQKWLSKLFFNALNTPNRKSDGFELPNGTSVWIPFLNGGLFEEHQEPQKHREIQFPPTLFELLFKFFNGYNFTIYENSPEDHTVAVDPEMLGHIFENLLEDNKDKGAFYTPKEIVHYMTQESLIEYLKTHLLHPREDIENLIKNHSTTAFTRDDLKEVEKLIDKVKICDPAIGSGAFPMGLLQEIFGLKAVIHYEMGYDVWSPAKIKQDIIQNSIYGVDIEEGAVDIARLRFWLSLVVDEPRPKPLPNLDYKIMQGNSLLESYDGIDLSNLSTADEQVIDEQATLNFGDDFNIKVTLFDAVSMEQFQTLMDKYFSPEEWEKKTNEKVDKIAVKKQINNVIEGKIHAKIFKEKEDTESRIKAFEQKFNIKKENDLEKLNTKGKEFKEYEILKIRHNEIENIENELIEFQSTDERPYFLWHLYFADVFATGGFDIVIGNPPYVDYRQIEKTITNNKDFNYSNKSIRPNLFIYFIEKSDHILKENGVLSFINPNQFMATDSGIGIRELLIDKRRIISFDDVSYVDVFKSAATYTAVWFYQKNEFNQNNLIKINKCNSLNQLGKVVFSIPQTEISKTVKKIIPINSEYLFLEKLEKDSKYNLKNVAKLLWGTSATGYGKKKINKEEFQKLSNVEKSGYKPIIQTSDTKKYLLDWKNEYIPIEIYSKKAIHEFEKNKIVIGRLTKTIQACFDDKNYYVGKATVIVDSTINIKALLALLNSKLINYWYSKKFEATHMAGGYLRFDIPYLEQIPISEKLIIQHPLLNILVDVIIKVKENKLLISDTVKNEHIANFFEEVVDGCVFELYFEEHMKEKGINIIDDVKNYINKSDLINDFENLDEDIKKQKIWELYKALKESVVNDKIKKFVVNSPDILKPIIQS